MEGAENGPETKVVVGLRNLGREERVGEEFGCVVCLGILRPGSEWLDMFSHVKSATQSCRSSTSSHSSARQCPGQASSRHSSSLAFWLARLPLNSSGPKESQALLSMCPGLSEEPEPVSTAWPMG